MFYVHPPAVFPSIDLVVFIYRSKMLLAPSDIHFLQHGLANLTGGDELTQMSKGFAGSTSLPKLQVAGKNGCWFALNNSSLLVVRELERQGKCCRVKVDVVPLSKVPASVQQGMIADTETDGQTADLSRETKHGYEKVPDRTVEESSLPVSVDEVSTSSSEDDLSDSDDDEDLTCNVCDRSFGSTRLLAEHQQKKRHFGCSVCDSLFPSIMTLEEHKEALDHWSEDEGNSNDSDDEETAEDVAATGKELERLL